MIVTRKLLIPTLMFLAFILLATILFNAVQETNQIEQNETKQLESLSQLFNTRLSGLESFAVALATEVANNPEVQEAFAAGDRQRLIELTHPAYLAIDSQFDVPQHQFHLPPATSFLRLHNLEQYGDDLSTFRNTVLAANAQHKSISGLEIGRGGLGMRGVVPVTYQNRHIGTVEFGMNVDQTFLQNLANLIGSDWQIFLSRESAAVATFAGATADAEGPVDELLFQAGTFESPFFVEADAYYQALNGQTAVSRVSLEDEHYAILSMPLLDFSDEVIGVVQVFSDRTAVVAQQRQNVITAVVASILSITLGGIGLTFIITRTLRPISELTDIATAITAGDLTRIAPVRSKDEVGILASTFNDMTAQLRESIDDLGKRVADRTHALETSVKVSQHLSTILDSEQLIAAIVKEIQTAFNYYHVHIYLFDENRQTLRMVGGTGEAGQAMLSRGHKIMKGKGLVGSAAVANQTVIVSDVSEDPTWLPNPLLPDTKSEIAVPITIGGQVLGVLDVQQNIVAGLTEEDTHLLQSVASQIAIALRNAHLFEQAQTQAEREIIINRIGQTIQTATDIESVLRIAVKELGQALGAKRTSIQLHNPGSPIATNTSNGSGSSLSERRT